MPQFSNAVSFVAACEGARERVAMAIWLALFALRRSMQSAPQGVKTLSFRGLKLSLDWGSSEHVPLREILIRNEYWPEAAFRPAAGQSVVDVGANAGVYSVYAASQVGRRGRVIAIEPNPPVVARLERNVRDNGLEGVCAIIPVAVSSQAGLGSFVVGANTSIGHLGAAGESGVAVPVRSLDDIVGGFDMPTIDLMKIDVEGAELAVLQGGSDSVRRTRRIVVEASEATAPGVHARLREAGFDRVFHVDVGRLPDGLLVFGERGSR